MKLSFFIRLITVLFISTIAVEQASACKCSSGFHGKNAWEVAKQEVEGSTVIFEGIPERFELQWNILKAKEGELITADNDGATSNNWPQMLITFRVHRAYKGDLGSEAQISTGLGGGDCGARFATGVTYLVYAYGPTPDKLGVGMCSPGGWMWSDSVATELRYLKNERPIPSDLADIKPVWLVKETAEQERQRQLHYEELKRQHEAATGQICGTVVKENIKHLFARKVSFLSTVGYSPVDHPTAQVKEDGSFCSERLGPGKYYLLFTGASDKKLSSAVYYPGVGDRSKATPIEVSAGQTQSNIVFKVPKQKTYSVRGFISIADKSWLTRSDVSIRLIDLDGSLLETWRGETVDFQGFFPLPKTKYFKFEDVPPGRYVAFVSAFGNGLYARKVEVNVTTHSKFISLELVHKK